MRAASPLLVIVLVAVACAGSASASNRFADIDGDGIRDSVEIYAVTDGSGPSSLLVTRGSNGETQSVEFGQGFGPEPRFLKIRDLDGVAGDEVIVDAEHITTFNTANVYTMSSGSLVLAGSFRVVGADSDYKFGISCAGKTGNRSIVQHQFKFSFQRRKWRRTNSTYVWQSNQLVRTGKRQKRWLAGKPNQKEVGVDC